MRKAWKWLTRIATVALVLAAAWYWLHGPSIEAGSYLVLDVSGSYSESRPGGLLARVLGHPPSLTDLTETLRKVRHDGRIAGVVVRLGDASIGWAQAHEIRGALALAKARGKRVVAELELELEPASAEVYIASVADEVYVAPAAAPLLTGLKASAVFLGGVWPKVDVTLQVEKIREYKTAGDEISRESMSPAHREMLESLLDDIDDHLVRTLAGARNLGAGEVRGAIAGGLTRPADFVRAGIANAVRGHEEILASLGGDEPVPTVSEKVYAGVRSASLGIGGGPSIAVVHASGAVHAGETSRGGRGFGSRSVAAAIAQAAGDDSIRAIVLRVASPGGSPAASDEIWLAVREAAVKKPVVASLGDVAASGGYYLASAASRIVASPGTLTGSIGVVFFKPDVSALLSRVGVHVETIRRGRYAGLLDLDKPLDEEELALVRTQIDDVYRLFLERVAEGRKKKPEDIDRIGGGRVWTGQQAFERGLVDEIGTFEDAVRAAANAAGIHDADKVRLVHYPRGEGLAAQLAEVGSGVAASLQPPLVARLADVLGESAAMLEMEPGVQLLAETVPTIE